MRDYSKRLDALEENLRRSNRVNPTVLAILSKYAIETRNLTIWLTTYQYDTLKAEEKSILEASPLLIIKIEYVYPDGSPAPGYHEYQ